MDSTRALICTLSLHDALPISRRHSPTHSKGDESMKRTCALLLFLAIAAPLAAQPQSPPIDRKSTRLNSSHDQISYAVFCLKKKNTRNSQTCHHERTSIVIFI